MTVASERLHAAIVEQRLEHRGWRELDQHVASAVAKQTGRGWRLDKIAHDARIDAVVALAMAVNRAVAVEPPVQLLGWL
jgi:phage terminase large subunit-like protein